MRKLLSALLIFSLAFGTLIGVKANQNIINRISVNKNDMMHLDRFELLVDFGGIGTNVKPGNRIPINLNTQDVELTYALPISLNMDEVHIAEVVETANGIEIVFTEEAGNLDDINGSFNIFVTASYSGDLDHPGEGKIEIEAENKHESIKVNYPGPGGDVTEKIYNKAGVASTTEENKVDWVFDLNAAKKPVQYMNANDEKYDFVVTDTLNETMTWDIAFNKSNKYVVYIEGDNDQQGSWYNIEEAKEKGVYVEFDENGKDLTIRVKHAVAGNSWDPTLNKTNISVRLTSLISDSVIEDESIKSVHNTSEIDFVEPDDSWIVEPSDKEDTVDINRQSGSASGTKRGTLNVFKVIEGKSVGIEGVEFEITRKDGKDIKIYKENFGKTLVVKTDSQGKINIEGLPVTTYVITEKDAPNWIEFDSLNPIIQEFEIKDKDTLNLEIENTKKLTDFSVQKKWLGIDGTEIDQRTIKVQLYRDDVPYLDPVEITNSHTWTELEVADDYGHEYVYSVKEIGENDGKVILNDSEFSVEYKTSQDETVITNQLTQEKIEISGEKTWNDFNNKLGYRPESIEINLLADGEIIDKQVVTEADDWKWSFTDLDKYSEGKEIEYTISETAIEHYSSEIDGYDVINVVTPGKTSVQVTKIWKNIEGELPESIIIKLLANGEVTDKELILTKADGWVGTFKGLPMYDDELEKIEYSVEEVEVEGFEIEIDGDMDSGFVVTNTYSPKEEPVKPPVVNPDKPPRTPEVASVNRPKPEELPVTGSSSIVMYAAIAMVGFGLFLLIKERKEHY